MPDSSSNARFLRRPDDEDQVRDISIKSAMCCAGSTADPVLHSYVTMTGSTVSSARMRMGSRARRKLGVPANRISAVRRDDRSERTPETPARASGPVRLETESPSSGADALLSTPPVRLGADARAGLLERALDLCLSSGLAGARFSGGSAAAAAIGPLPRGATGCRRSTTRLRAAEPRRVRTECRERLERLPQRPVATW